MLLSNLFFSFVIFFIAFTTASVLSKYFYLNEERERNAQLDGLRGVLALMVFICHAAAWYHFLHTGSYNQAGPGLFHQFAKIGVFMFFMITGYLFTGKILREREKGINWTQFVISRLLRITPLYLFAISLMLIIVFIASGFQFRQPTQTIGPDILEWLTFTLFGSPILNEYNNTLLITSHVQWTLVYEWLFYFSLPLVAVAMRVKVPLLLMITTTFLLLSVYTSADHLFLPSGFLGGALTAIICHYLFITPLIKNWAFSVIAIGLVVCQGVLFPEFAYQQPTKIPAALLCCSFLIIAGGNNLFGILTTQAAKYLGKISYSMYLMHGIILFCSFKFVVGFERAASFSKPVFALLVFLITVMVILVSTATNYLIEEPAMKKVGAVSRFFEKFASKLKKTKQTKPL